MSQKIRPARLDDAQAITTLACEQVERWQRMTSQQKVEDLPYEDLTIYERWLHGGAWLSIETMSIWLNHLLNGGGQPIVVDEQGDIIAYAEVYMGLEPEPFGEVAHLGKMIVANGYEITREDFFKALLQQGKKYGMFTASCSGYDQEQAQFYQAYGLQPISQVQRYKIAAQLGQSFYKANESELRDAQHIENWQMVIGRIDSSRHHWETLWSRLWNALPEIAKRKTHFLHISASGQEVLTCIQQQVFDPRNADVYCWSPKPLTNPIMIALRDWAHRTGYRNLVMDIPESESKSKLLADAEKQAHFHEVYASVSS